MKYLNKIDDSTSQRMFLAGGDGERITVFLRYIPTQQAWFMDIKYGDKNINGIRIVNSLNILRQYTNNISFGFLCQTKGGLDPYFIDDFSTRRADLYLLDEADITKIEEEAFL